MIRFEALQARYGDCLFVTLPGDTRDIRLLIDGGPARVYQTSLKPKLDKMRTAAGDGGPIELDAVMVSHIDEDHILGVLDLMAAIQDADEKKQPRPVQIRWLLHNSFDHLIDESEGGTARAIGGETILASLDDGISLQGLDLPTARLVLQSYGQGSKLSSLAAALKITRNPPKQELIRFAEDNPRVLTLGRAKITIVGPLQEDIDNLRKEWIAWKAKQKSTQDLAAYLDTSVPNLSSIVGLLECDGKTILLTGDARGDNVIKGLEQAGFLSKNKPVVVDICKLPHHGSARNLDPEFFKRIHADHYVASGDGTYGNPDRETFEMLENARPKGGYTVHITYDAASIDATHADWRKQRGKSAFVASKDGLVPLLKRWRDKGKIKVVEGPIAIDL